MCADYLTKVVVLGKSSSSLHVREIMTPQSKLMTVSPNQSVLEVMSLMIDNNFRHVPVVRPAIMPPISLLVFSVRPVFCVLCAKQRLAEQCKAIIPCRCRCGFAWACPQHSMDGHPVSCCLYVMSDTFYSQAKFQARYPRYVLQQKSQSVQCSKATHMLS